ncbi:hypothetical protein AKO1_003803 [Acrasis kona]|uniref:Integrator complex subunit 1 R3 domain-containing protein n=1 Tax=Acrasis kona TaxID=1008807 RepID=A0AAW2Z6L2_9EUKA
MELIKSCYTTSDPNHIHQLRSLLLRSPNDVIEPFRSLSNYHSTNPHITLMIQSCIQDLKIELPSQCDPSFLYISSLYDPSSSSLQELDRDEELHFENHSLPFSFKSNSSSDQLPPFDSFHLQDSKNRSLIADLISLHDPAVESIDHRDDPYLCSLALYHRDASQLVKLINHNVDLSRTVLSMVQNVNVNDSFVTNLISNGIRPQSNLNQFIQTNADALCMLVDSIVPKNAIDPLLHQKSNLKNSIRIDPDSHLGEFLYSMVPSSFEAPTMVLLPTQMNKFLHSLILKMTSSSQINNNDSLLDKQKSQFAYEMLRKCARQFPLVIYGYLKTIVAVLDTGYHDSISASEIISTGMLKRYQQVLGILILIRKVVFDHLGDFENEILLDAYLKFIKNVIMESDLNRSYVSPEHIELRSFAVRFLNFLNYDHSNASNYVKKNQNVLDQVNKHFKQQQNVVNRGHVVDDDDDDDLLQMLTGCDDEKILEYYSCHVLNLMNCSKYSSVCIVVLLKLLDKNSSHAVRFVEKYISCLKHNDESVRFAVIEHAYDVFTYCQSPYDQQLLKLLFENGSREALSMLSKIVSMYVNTIVS